MAERDEDLNDSRSAEQIRQDIAAKRETISTTVDRLGERIQEKLDWRGYVARYPYATLGAAAGLGFAASFLVRRKRNPVDRIVDAVTDSIEDAGDQLRSAVQGFVTRVGGRSVVKGTLYGLAGRLALSWLKNTALHAFQGDTNGYHERSSQHPDDVTGAAWASKNNPQPSSARPV